MLPSERTFSGSSWSPSTSRNDRAAGGGEDSLRISRSVGPPFGIIKFQSFVSF